MEKLSKNEQIDAFNDLVLCPISMDQVTRCLTIIGEKELTGVFHLSGKKDITYYDMDSWKHSRESIESFVSLPSSWMHWKDGV